MTMSGSLLDKFDELGIADNTLVVYSTDNGAESVHLARRWHHARSTARRAPPGRVASACHSVVRWPGVIKPGTVINDIMSHEDWLPTFLHAAGVPGIVEKAQKRVQSQRQELEGPPGWPRLHAVLQG